MTYVSGSSFLCSSGFYFPKETELILSTDLWFFVFVFWFCLIFRFCPFKELLETVLKKPLCRLSLFQLRSSVSTVTGFNDSL